MAIEGFDYKGFAASMAEQAKELVPAELKDNEKEYIIKTLGNFTLLAGEALYNDESLNLTEEQAVLITQIIAEWSFHKSIDLIHSGILPQYWDGIMQKIAFTIFEIAKQAMIRNLTQDQLLQAVEYHVVKVYNQSIEELEKKGIIDADTKNRAESQSNIDDMAKEAQAQAELAKQDAEKLQQTKQQEQQATPQNMPQKNNKTPNKSTNQSVPEEITKKQLKLMSLALLLKVLSQDKVTTILNKFDPNDSSEISRYMNMANLESRLDGDLVAECLNNIKEFLPIKRKLTKENVLLNLKDIYDKHDRESVEKVIKYERPFVKRFIAKSYDNEYEGIPLKVAGIIQEYIEESLK